MKISSDFLYDNYDGKIFFSFSDKYIQELYQYTLDDLLFFLKLALLYGEDIYITGANVWQSNLTYSLYKQAYSLIDNDLSAGIVHLSTRKTVSTQNIFDSYFVERSEENEHFLTLPSIYTLLDCQIYDKRDIAKQLDESALPIVRVGDNVSKLLSQNTINFFNSNNVYVSEEMLMYLHGNLLSRSAIVSYVLGLPYRYDDIIKLIDKINFIYHLSNAESNKATLLFPQSKYNLILYSKKTTINFLKICYDIGLTKNKIRKLSFNAINVARKVGLLDSLHMLFRFLVNVKENNKIKLLLYKSIYTIVNLICCFDKNVKLKIGKNYSCFESEISSSFTFSLNNSFVKGEKLNMEEKRISSATVIEEMNKRFSLDEIKNISIAIFDGYDQFPHASKTELSRELCLTCKRKDKMEQLLGECLKINSSFSVLPENMNFPTTLIDWKAKSTLSGDYISFGEYEKIIESKSRFQSVNFLERGLEIKDRICMIKTMHGNINVRATGLLLKNNFVITNKHVFFNESIVENAEAIFGYDECKGSVTQSVGFKNTNIFISRNYDLALAQLNDSRELNINFVSIKIGCPQNCIDDIIPIIQHPNGMPKQICIGHNSLKYVDEEIIQYLTDTLPGSSGSPVFNSNWELIGLHSKGGNLCEPRTGNTFFRNEGINVRTIEKFIKEETSLALDYLL